MKEISDQIFELQRVCKYLTHVNEKENEILVSGSLHIEASYDGFESIFECFDIELIISVDYPEILPSVRETGLKIDSNCGHIYGDRKLCLAVPIEERRLFLKQPSLLGFVNRLLIPYLFSYCRWKQDGKYPFGESEHGTKGIVQHYIDKLDLTDEIAVLAVISYLYEYGYRGHHACPCGAGEKVRNCHAKPLRALNDQHTIYTLEQDFRLCSEYLYGKMNAGEIQIPKALQKRVLKHFKSESFVLKALG